MLISMVVIVIFSPYTAYAADHSTIDNFDQGDVFARLQRGELVMAEWEYEVPQEPTVYLSFDDGPSKWTPMVLDILKQEGVSATFFVLGTLVEKQADTVRRIVEEGHTLGNHTFDHSYKSLYPDFSGFWEQIQHTEQIIMDQTGIRPTVIRAPGGTHGHFDAYYYYYLDQAGYRVYDWNIDSGDSKKRNVPADTIVKSVTSGTIPYEAHVLMHDGSGHGETVKALPEIIRFFKDKGYRFKVYNENVKPVNFSLVPLKHQRSNNFIEHGQMMATLMENVMDRQREDSFMDQAHAIVEEASIARMESRPKPRLNILTSSQDFSFAYDQYELSNKQLRVPLRAFAEGLGADVSWDAVEKQATVTMGMKQVVFYPNLGKITVYHAGELTATLNLTDIREEKQKLTVPLRIVAALLDYRVVSYSETGGGREVQLAGSRSPALYLSNDLVGVIHLGEFIRHTPRIVRMNKSQAFPRTTIYFTLLNKLLE
ncbi:MAG: polysaccharide deacetylase [Paenibacillaceae bacterium]